jgi:hypothetical protein
MFTDDFQILFFRRNYGDISELPYGSFIISLFPYTSFSTLGLSFNGRIKDNEGLKRALQKMDKYPKICTFDGCQTYRFRMTVSRIRKHKSSVFPSVSPVAMSRSELIVSTPPLSSGSTSVNHAPPPRPIDNSPSSDFNTLSPMDKYYMMALEHNPLSGLVQY